MLRSIKALHGFAIGATDGDVGTVRECYFDDETYAVRYLVVDTGAWLSERKVLLSPIAFRAMDWEHRRITTALTKTQVEKSPEIDTDRPVSRQHETNYFGYYGYAPYWTGSYLWGISPYPSPGPEPAVLTKHFERERRWVWAARKGTSPHLRSSRAVTGYHIHATDGDIGHVSDFLVDDCSWAIRYLIVDTTNWWAGKKVLLSPGWIERVDWNHSKVHATVTQAQIRNSPEFDPTRPVERAYEEQLYRHYGQPHYWGE
jgi:sporulation protein YlmC with PRC-barrel domain